LRNSSSSSAVRSSIAKVADRLRRPPSFPVLELAQVRVRDGLAGGLLDLPEGEPLGRTQIGEQGADVGGMPHELGALASGSLAAISHLFSIAESLDRSSGLRYRLIE
jgi:hypothetical protein